MSNRLPEIWFGSALRGFGGDPPPRADAIWRILTPRYTDGPSFTDGFFREDLFSWDVPYVRLGELIVIPPDNCQPAEKVREFDEDLKFVISHGLMQTSKRLREIPMRFFDEWRNAGRELDVFVIVQMPIEGISVSLPGEFLSICRELGLTIEIYTDQGSNVGKRRKRMARFPKRDQLKSLDRDKNVETVLNLHMIGETALVWIGVFLRGFGGTPPPRAQDLAEFLGIDSRGDNFARMDLCSSEMSLVVLANCASIRKGRTRFDPEEQLSDLVPIVLADASRCLRQMPVHLFEKWRSKGRELDLLVAASSPAEAVRVFFPKEFLSVCDELKLPIEVYTDHGGKLEKAAKSNP